MGIDDESDVAATLQIGPTSEGMVRVYVEGEGFSLPLDFEPEEAEEIADELRGAAERARAAQRKGKGKAAPAREGNGRSGDGRPKDGRRRR
jgi:hypothetical protein